MSYSATTSINVLSIGGSRNIGFYASLRLLDAGATVTFLLRNPSTLDRATEIQQYQHKGTAFLVEGDALIKSDVERAWEAAKANGGKHVDLLLFTVGGTPEFSLLKGARISPPNLVTQSLLNTLSTLPKSSPQPRIIVVTSIGVTHSSYAATPCALKPVYAYLVKEPAKDKLGVERTLAHVAGWEWDSNNGEPREHIIGPSGNWMKMDGLPGYGELKKILLVRPALLTDGECLADQGKMYRVSKEDITGWSISRRDVAHFIADAVFNRWEEFENGSVSLAY